MAANIIITEKPDASKRIAEALSGESEKRLKKKERRGAYWYEFKKGEDNFFVVPAVGHIFALDAVKDGSGWSYPVFKTEWIPSFQKKGAEFSEKYYRNIEDVISENLENNEKSKSNTNFIIATDYDTEGSVIGYNILRFLGKRNDAERMKFSTLTKDELVESYENRSKQLDFGQIESGLARHYLDFYWGINLTRALTLAMKNAAEKGGFAILSTGRVQGPTLGMLLEKELEIRKFKPVPFWQLEALVDVDGVELVATYEKDKIWKKDEAESVYNACKKRGTKAVVKNIDKRRYKQKPPVPFNTTEMQAEAYAQFRYSPKQTLSIVESLYQSGAVSYPRSSSQKLPPSINYKRILEAIAKLKPYEMLAKELLKKSKLIPHEGNRTDPAHPAIYPTFEPPALANLTSQQKRMYDLIVRRFLAVFADDALREAVTVDLDIEGNKFKLAGRTTIELGWTKYYGTYLAFEEQQLPEMKVGDVLGVKKVELLEKETQPPGRFSQGSILKEMEKKELGTRATRAEILQTLYDRKYIIGQSIVVTKLGETVATVLKEYCPRILSEDLTRKFEEEMDEVYNGKKKRDEVVEEAMAVLTETLGEFKKSEKEIGKNLLSGLIESRKEEYAIGTCPNCGGELRIIVSKATKKRFVGCGQYPKCKTAFPLPQAGFLTKLGTACKECGMPMIQIVRKGRRPYRMCINHKCKTKENWKKQKDKKVK